ncbi:DIP1281 family NlpC/P60 protein [Corynebacterium bovis]|uniref:DIP1281 family NlpC/P60 protein n=1 Tax=Corynebacterium bovis TaxID=36808 RepID=UPI0027BAC785|nr:NlpC/P60 family protein [Corynebacterium bovis]
MALRTNARGSARGSIARSTRALLAFAVTAGVSVHAGTAVADPSGDDAVSVEKYLADLVSQVSSAEKDVAGAEGELGGLRESANKARVDFDRSQAEAQEAQDKVLSARGHLDSSQTDLEKAQAKLNDIARSAYVNGGDAKPVTLASGGDAVADTLDRSSYIRLATEKQKSEVDRLDLARTQAANEESALRGSRDEADSRLRDARQAREAAEQTLRDSAQAVAQKMQDYQRLRAQQDEAKAKLEAARRAVDSQSAAASSFDKRRAAEAAADAADKAAEEKAAADKAAADKAAADKAAADKAAADKAAAENAEPQQGADGTTATPGVRIDEKLGPVGAGEKAAVSAATGSTEATASSTTPSATTTAATSTPETESPATTAATTSASTSTTEIPDSFPDTPEGDALRQAAIDGLRATADAATTAAQGASGAHAVDAALTAGRQTASQHYRAITAADETGGAATGTATDSDSDSDTTSDGTTSGTTSGTDSTGTTSGTDSTGGTGTSDDSGAGTSGTGTSGTSGTSGDDDEDDSDDSTSSTGSGTSSGTSSGSGSTGKHSSSTGDTSGTRSERIERVIARGKSQLGVRYSWGGGNYDGPTIGIRDGGVADQYGDYQNVGFDCSGLMMYAFAAAGVKLDHYSGYQYTAGEQIPVAQAERGDMLFWGAGGSEHVALYLGDGKMLEAPQSGSQVRISDVRWGGIQPYAVRVID